MSNNITSNGWYFEGSNGTPVPVWVPSHVLIRIPAPPKMVTICDMNVTHINPNIGSNTSLIRPISSAITQMANNVSLGTNIYYNPNQSKVGWSQSSDHWRELKCKPVGSGANQEVNQEVVVKQVDRPVAQTQQISINGLSNCPPIDIRRVFIDGILIQLYYLNDTKAVVLLNAPQNANFDQIVAIDPHLLDARLVCFEGKPTKIFIDIGKKVEFVLLEFNGEEKRFFCGNNRTAQRIKLGGPAKEIILNGKPYTAQFGGQAISVHFEGDCNETHTLKLEGIQPIVNISNERRLDLWHNFVQKVFSGST